MIGVADPFARPDKQGSVLLELVLLVFLELLVQPRSPLTSNVYSLMSNLWTTYNNCSTTNQWNGKSSGRCVTYCEENDLRKASFRKKIMGMQFIMVVLFQ